QDRDADATTIGGARRCADSHHASGNDLRRAASSASWLAFPAHASHVLVDLIRKDGTVWDHGKHGGIVLESGQRPGVRHAHGCGMNAVEAEPKDSAGVSDGRGPGGRIRSLPESHDVILRSLSESD